MSWFSQVFGTSSSAPGFNSGSGVVAPSSPDDGIDWAAKPGDRLAEHYIVKCHLGRGGFGQVYLCFYDLEARDCAVKILRPDRRYEPKNLALLREEARRWVGLGVHANVVAAFNLEEHARLPCIVMEYMPGAQPLAKLCELGRPLPWKGALAIGGQVACGLDHAWQTARMAHRDVKPSNILFSEYSVKLTDFGLSMAGQDSESAGRVGTLHYMAPEVFDGTAANVVSDIYSFGVTIYELAAGQWPYGAKPQSPHEAAERHRTARARDLHSFAPDAPADFCELIMSCLAKSPGARPQTYLDLVARLDAIARRELGGSFLDIQPSQTIGEIDALINRSSLHNRLGEGAEAKDYAERALRVEPDNGKAWFAKGNAAKTLGDLSTAKSCFERAFASGPDSENGRRVLANLALTSYDMGDEAAGRQWLLRAIDAAQAGGSIGELDNLSSLFPKIMSAQNAITLCDRIIAANPSAAVTWSNRAAICRQSGRFVEAKRSAEQALQLNPLYAKAWANLANALLCLRQFSECRTAAEKALDIEPKTAGAYCALAAALWELGDYAGAQRTMRQAVQLFPDNLQIRQAAQSLQN